MGLLDPRSDQLSYASDVSGRRRGRSEAPPDARLVAHREKPRGLTLDGGENEIATRQSPKRRPPPVQMEVDALCSCQLVCDSEHQIANTPVSMLSGFDAATSTTSENDRTAWKENHDSERRTPAHENLRECTVRVSRPRDQNRGVFASRGRNFRLRLRGLARRAWPGITSVLVSVSAALASEPSLTSTALRNAHS